MLASEACESTCEACEPFLRAMRVTVTSRLESFLTRFYLFLSFFIFFTVNYETNLFKGLCGDTRIFGQRIIYLFIYLFMEVQVADKILHLSRSLFSCLIYSLKS